MNILLLLQILLPADILPLNAALMTHIIVFLLSLICIITLYLLIRNSQTRQALTQTIHSLENVADRSGLTLLQYDKNNHKFILWGIKQPWFPNTESTSAPYIYNWLEFEKNTHPDDKHLALTVFNNLTNGKENDECVFRLRAHNEGHYTWHHIKVLSDNSQNTNAPPLYCGYLMDITKDIHLQKKLRFELQEYQFIVQNTNCIIIRWTEDGILTYFNNYAEDFFGYKANEVIGRHVVGTIVPETESAGRQLRPLMDKISKRPERFDSNINENIKRNGERVWIAWDNRHYTLSGNMPEVLSTGFDITQRLLAEEALKNSEREKMTIINSITEGVVFIGIDKKIRWGNIAASRIVGKDPQSIQGMNCNEFFGYDCDNKNICASERASKTRRECHFNGTLPSGRMITLTAVPVFNKDKIIGVVETFTDITEQTELENQLRYSQKMDAVGQLAGGIAHDFNNKLCGLLGFANLLMETELNHDQKRYLKTIIDSGECCSELTAQLLAFARKGKFNVSVVDINEKIEYLCSFLRHSINPLVKVKLNLCPQPAIIDADENQISNMLLNLAVNASEAMPEGGTLSFTTVGITHDPSDTQNSEWSSLPRGRYINIIISDTGCGIPENMLEQVFDPFYTTKESCNASGMGLAAAYGIVTSHNGKIKLSSQIGQGTDVNIILPYAVSPTKDQEITLLPFSTAGLNALVIEDETVNQLLLQEELIQMGFNVTIAKDGQEGVNKFNNEKFDLVLLDMIMPRMSGRDAFYEIMGINPEAKIIIISGYEADSTIREILSAGALDFISKPFERKEIRQSILKVISSGMQYGQQ